MKKQIPVVSLFCGCGGMDYGLKQKGFIPIIAIDNNEIAVKTYNENNKPQVAIVSDIAKLSERKIISIIESLKSNTKPRGVIGGPPCQSFSTSNVFKNPRDPRHSLPIKFASIVKALNDKYTLDFCLFENVVGLNSKKHESIFKSIKEAFIRAGFNLFIEVLNAKYFGVAQSRKRLFIVGINKLLFPSVKFEFPKRKTNRLLTVRDVIGSLPETTYYKRTLSSDDIPFHQNHWTMNPKSPKFRNYHNSDNLKNGRSFRKLDWNKPSNTLAFGHREINVHPNGHRRISVLEAMLIQGLPFNYKIMGNLTQQVNQVSDTLPPNIASAIGESIQKAIYSPQIRISKKLIKWYEENHRDYPWRNTYNPYSILIAEKLLQQTSVNDSVVKVYNRILLKYPNIKSLSCANSDDLILIMASLGLKYRAYELIKLAKVIVKRHSGEIPGNHRQLIELPGIGEYIARAILCFAYGYNVPIVDTNISRLIYRIFSWKGKMPSNPARVKRLITQVEKFIINGKAKIINLAMLDLCNSICSIKDPNCLACPISKECQYYRVNRTT
ncbi:MAG: DNA (cytosine-5-)-methyltransferase [Promethearchaeota archaeon]